MQAKMIDNKKEEAFEPIEIKIKIESKDDLLLLWHVLNIDGDDLIALKNKNDPTNILPLPYEFRVDALCQIWDILNGICKRKGYRKDE